MLLLIIGTISLDGQEMRKGESQGVVKIRNQIVDKKGEAYGYLLQKRSEDTKKEYRKANYSWKRILKKRILNEEQRKMTSENFGESKIV